MENKKFFGSLMAFALTVLLLAATIFAWFSLQEKADVGDLILQTNMLDADILIEISKNSGDYEELTTAAELEVMFFNTIPSDTFDFRLTILNASTRSANIRVELVGITSSNEEDKEDFDLRNVFYINEGKVTVNGTTSILDVITTDPIEEKGQILNQYNLNNLIVNNKITLLPTTVIDQEEDAVIEFTLIYDQNTSLIDYTTGVIHISSIHIYTS